MKYLSKLALILALVLTAAFAFPGHVYAQGPDDGGKVVFGGTYRLASGQSLNGSLAVFGGSATLESGSKVNGSIVIFGGNLDILGDVNGDITTVGGALSLGDTAHLHGSIYTVGGALNRSPNAKIDGNITTGSPDNFNFRVPQINRPFGVPVFPVNLQPIADVFTSTFQALALAAIAALVALLMLRPTQRIVGAINAQPVMSGAFGLLTLLVAPALLVILAITIILIPLSVVGFILLLVAGVFGWIALGMVLGHLMAGMFKTEWTPPIEAGLGTLVLSLVIGLINAVPVINCLSWLVSFILAMIGLGAVVLTRFGTRVYLGGISGPPTPGYPPSVPATITPPPAPPAAPEGQTSYPQPPAPQEPVPPVTPDDQVQI